MSTPLDEAEHYLGQSSRQRRFAPMVVRLHRNTVRLPAGIIVHLHRNTHKGKELAAIHQLLPQWAHWKVVNEHHVTRTFTFPDFKQALDFVNRVGGVAEEQGHHPDILLSWGKAEVTIWTHMVDGLTESDFILAAKIDRLLRS